MMAFGSSVRGLSLVTMQKSARSAAILPIFGRLVLSRSPPQPNSATTRPFAKPRTAFSTFSTPSGEWA